MELVQPRPKKCGLPENLPLPIILKKDNTIYKIKGVYNGVSVIIENREDMKNIVSMGYFGKANLSRSYPQFIHDEKVEIIRQRQYDRRRTLGDSLTSKESRQVLVVPDSDDEQEDYFTNLKPVFQIDQSSTKETVWLSPEEAFFLMEAVGCFEIYYDNVLLSPEKCWNMFSDANKYFQFNYVAYHHFRGKNWVVKPGIKFGGDYLLYQKGPPFFHGSYLVIIDVLGHDLQRIESLSRRSLDNLPIHGLNRLCETAGKTLLILQIILPECIQQTCKFSFTNLRQIQLRELLLKRWIPSQENK